MLAAPIGAAAPKRSRRSAAAQRQKVGLDADPVLRPATFRLTPTTVGNHTFAEWWADFDVTAGGEEAMAAQIGDGVFVAGFEALEKKLACQGGAAHRSRQAPQL